MKQSWQNNIDKAFKYHISVNRHVAKDMLDYIKELELVTQDLVKLMRRVLVQDGCDINDAAWDYLKRKGF